MPKSMQIGDLLDPNAQVAPGVFGYTIETDHGLHVPWVMAEHEGNGDVGRFIDSLPTDRRVCFPWVLSPRLEGMLVRRGFVPVAEWSADFDEWVDCYTREPKP